MYKLGPVSRVSYCIPTTQTTLEQVTRARYNSNWMNLINEPSEMSSTNHILKIRSLQSLKLSRDGKWVLSTFLKNQSLLSQSSNPEQISINNDYKGNNTQDG